MSPCGSVAAVLADDLHGVLARHAGAGETQLPLGMAAVGMCGLVEAGDGHGALALAVEIVELGAQQRECALQIGEVHRGAAVDDGLEAARVGRTCAGVIDEARHHGGRSEHADVFGCRQRVEHLVGFERAFEDDVVAAAGDVGEAVEAGAMRQRRGVQDGVARVDVVDVGVVAVAGKQQVAVAEHRALGPPGGAAGVEQPGLGVAVAGAACNGIALQQRPMIA